jgi:hypothetical protein
LPGPESATNSDPFRDIPLALSCVKQSFGAQKAPRASDMVEPLRIRRRKILQSAPELSRASISSKKGE